MENKTNLLFINSVFNNKNLNNKFKKDFLALTNELMHKKQNRNLFSNTIRDKYQYNSNLKKNDFAQKILRKKEKGKEFKAISCPNNKKFEIFGLNRNYINSIQSKIFYKKEMMPIISTLKYKNINRDFHQINDENSKLSIYLKDNKSSKFIKNFKGNQTLYGAFSINKNKSLQYSKIANNIVNDCVKIRQINPERTEGNDKKDSFEKMKLTSCNSWFRKTTFQKMKVNSLPKMKNLNEKDKDKDKEKDKEKEMNEKERVKTFLHINKNTLRQIPYEYETKKIHKIKQKNLIISYEILSMPGTERGKQKINQDTYFILPNINNTHNAKIFGIFDGHGINGDKLSQEIRDYFIEFFSDKSKYEKEKLIDNNQRLSTDENLEKIDKYITKNNFREINQIFKQINSKIHEKYQQNNFCTNSGSTSNIILILNDKKAQTLNKIISVNLGDSKSILINKENQIFQLNKRHTPDDIEEKERIEKNGGEISRVDWADYGPLRIFYKNKAYPGLSMTRAFGDFNAENLGFNSIPDIVEYDINEKNPKIIISATDGVWQFLSNEQVKNIILPYYEEDNITGGIQKLINSARKMWEMKNPRFIDDITIILIFFR